MREFHPNEAAPTPAKPEVSREMLTCVGLAVVLVAVGVLFAAAYRYIASGATLSIAAMASLFPIIHQLMAIGRDQVKLETYLLRYQIALQLAHSPDGKILDRFLDETSMAENAGISSRRRRKRT